MKYSIFLFLIFVILLCYIVFNKNEHFMESGRKIVEKQTKLKINNPNKQYFTLSLAFPIPMGKQDIIKLGNDCIVSTTLTETLLEVEVLYKNTKELGHFVVTYNKQDVIDNIINNKLYNFSFVYNRNRCEIIFEGEIKKINLNEDEDGEQLIPIFESLDTITYLYSGAVYEYEFSNKARNYNYICNQNKTCGFKCSFKCTSDQMGANPSECQQNCIEYGGCSSEECNKLCVDPNTRLWKPEDNRCQFDAPYGETELDCLANCKKKDPNCSMLECQEACRTCSDNTLCGWVNKTTQMPEPPKTQLPLAPVVEIEKLDGGVVLHWSNNTDKDINNIKAYLISYYPTQQPHKGQQVRVVKADADTYEEKIDNLNEDQFYTFIVRAFNNNEELSPNSNQLVVKPQKYNTEIPRKDILIDNLPDYYKFCNI